MAKAIWNPVRENLSWLFAALPPTNIEAVQWLWKQCAKYSRERYLRFIYNDKLKSTRKGPLLQRDYNCLFFERETSLSNGFSPKIVCASFPSDIGKFCRLRQDRSGYNGAENISYWETKIWEIVPLYYSNPVCFNILNNLLYSYVLFVYFWCHGSLVLACKIFFNWDIGTTEWSHFG